MAFAGPGSHVGIKKETYESDLELLNKFYKKYPEVKYFPAPSRVHMSYGGTIDIAHPASMFIKKQRDLIKKGYTEQKAFALVETELGKLINQ